MHPMLNIAVKAARRAGSVIQRASLNLDTIRVEKKKHNDFVTDVDRAAEQAIVDMILEAYPKHAILAEESGAKGVGSSIRMDHRPHRRHHQLPAWPSAIRHLHRAGTQGPGAAGRGVRP
jgi:3'-phosphoadenosine 5'-phosphosulfate (PAPS) 3'-phosphatase